VVSSHALSASIKSIKVENTLPEPYHLERYFIAIYEDRTSPATDVANFQGYFTTGSSTPPHSNYRVIPWVYGPSAF